jgi:hypothetical protein
MPNLPWVLAVSITLGAGPLAALDLPWPWWTPSSADAERRGNYSFQFDSENPGDEEKLASEGPSQEARPEDGLISGGIQYSTTMCTLGLDQGGSAHHCRQEP